MTAATDAALSSQAIGQEITDGIAFATALAAKQPLAAMIALIKLAPEVRATVAAIAADYPREVAAVDHAFAVIQNLFPKGAPAAPKAPPSYDDELRQAQSDSNSPG